MHLAALYLMGGALLVAGRGSYSASKTEPNQLGPTQIQAGTAKGVELEVAPIYRKTHQGLDRFDDTTRPGLTPERVDSPDWVQSLPKKIREAYTDDQLAILIDRATVNLVDYKGVNYMHLFPYVASIRVVENGAEHLAFGIIPTENDSDEKRAYLRTFKGQAANCCCTVRNKFITWEKGGTGFQEFIDYLGSKYCPTNADNDPTGLNHNWLPNMKSLLSQFVETEIE